ncbi:excitatory amino acid transporter-like [Saccostrea echinata]|uniref:excitatory amino acid transporter-like n=1 Tax=Saccostrea echinata TaxID=191078 RepID=UPI002A81FCEF|nr:excitatory amino acid transporter-like [Saccostrea echinata]
MKLKNDDHHKRSCIQNTQRIFYGQLLFVMTFLAVIIGFVVGFGIREARPSEDVIHWIGMPGDLFMRSLKMMIVPLIVTSVINSTASLDPKSNGRVGMISITYIFLTNMMGCLIAITLVYIIKPGRINLEHDKKVMVNQIQPQDIFADLLRNIIPDNLVEATFRKTQTKLKPGIVRMEPKNLGNVTNGTADVKQTMEMVKNVGKSDGPNILGLILACMFIGIAAGRFREKAKTFLNFFEISAEIVLQILRWFIWLTPVGVASLIAASFAGTRDVSETFISLGYFVLAVTLGILFIQAILLPLIYYALIRKNPFYNIFCIKRAWLMGFSFASSTLAIPDLLHACENIMKFDKRITRFVIPLCCTSNTDGSALFISAGAMFIANVSGYNLTFGNVIIIGILTTLSSLSLPGLPSASMVALVMVLSAISVPVQEVSLLFAVEWFLDRLRTGANVESHFVCAAVTNHFCKRKCDLKEENVENNPEPDIEIIVQSDEEEYIHNV